MREWESAHYGMHGAAQATTDVRGMAGVRAMQRQRWAARAAARSGEVPRQHAQPGSFGGWVASCAMAAFTWWCVLRTEAYRDWAAARVKDQQILSAARSGGGTRRR